MKTTNIITFLSLSLLVSCTSFKKDYVITDASRNSKPSWVKTEKKENDNNYYYFVSSANNANQRLCEKSAIARATSVVAGQITNNIANDYTETTTDTNGNINILSKENLAQKILMNIAGLKKDEAYWEKRQYQSNYGALDNKSEYKCYVLKKERM